MDKKKIVRCLLITLSVILGVLVFLSITGTVAHAAGLVDNTVSDANAYSKYPLENYFEPFFSNEDKQKDSFGLGLYIIQNILKANSYTLTYEYENQINRFICKKDKQSTI